MSLTNKEAAGLALFTIVEDVTLVAWLALVRIGHIVAGALTLPIGFFIEHVIAVNAKNDQPAFQLGPKPYGPIAVNALLETVIWIVWLALWPLYPFSLFGIGIPLWAILWLQVALTVEHNVTDNIFHGRPVLSGLLNKRVYGFTLLENAGATAWLGLIGAGVPVAGVIALVIFQYLEHRQALLLGRR